MTKKDSSKKGTARDKAAVVTVNWSDFEAIRYYCDVKVIKASDYFRR